VLVDIHFSGICHSDLHQLRGEWGINTYYPMVPGHEMAGIVRAVGDKVTKFAPGDRVGVGVWVDSCGSCGECKARQEQYCNNVVPSYNAKVGDELIFGGYSQSVTVKESFVVRIPDNLDLACAAPLLCAGITTWSPLVHFGARQAGAEWNVGVIGVGGLGHLAAKFAKSFGNKVTLISRSSSKKGIAEAIGVDYLAMDNTEQVNKVNGTFNLIINTVSADLPSWSPYFNLLKTDGRMVLVGLPPHPIPVESFDIVGKRRSFSGSMVGSISETEDMLQFCNSHKIVADVQLISVCEVNEKLQDLISNSSREQPRFVIKIAETLSKGDWEVRTDSRTDPNDWEVRGNIIPPSANLHAKLKKRKETIQAVEKTVAPIFGISIGFALGIAATVLLKRLLNQK